MLLAHVPDVNKVGYLPKQVILGWKILTTETRKWGGILKSNNWGNKNLHLQCSVLSPGPPHVLGQAELDTNWVV